MYSSQVVIGEGTTIDPDCKIGMFTIIGSGVHIGAGTTIGSHCILADNCCIGKGNEIHNNVEIEGNVTIGDNSRIFSFTCIGKEAQYYSKKPPTSGNIVIGSNSTIREHVSIHLPSEKPSTLIGSNVYIMASVHVGHDSIIEDNAVVSSGSVLCGFSHIMNGARIGVGANVHQHTTVGAGAFVGMGSAVVKDVLPHTIYISKTQNVLHGINQVGLERAGKSEGDIECLKEWYENLSDFSTSADEDDGAGTVCDSLPLDAWFSEDVRSFIDSRNGTRQLAT